MARRHARDEVDGLDGHGHLDEPARGARRRRPAPLPRGERTIGGDDLGPPVGEAIRAAIYAEAHLVITTGGTGLTPTDRTPEQTRALLDVEIPGLADAIRTSGLPAVPTAVAIAAFVAAKIFKTRVRCVACRTQERWAVLRARRW